MTARYYAHTREGRPEEEWQPLTDHLQAVAEKAREFAEPFGAGEWAYLAGLWHDAGKFSDKFQAYLNNQDEACAETQPGRVDHSSAGAQHAVQAIRVLGHLLGFAIAGHHCGLLDGRSEDACQEKRLKKELLTWKHGLKEIPQVSLPDQTPNLLRSALGNHDAFAVSLFIRMLFSCLVDADFLDTERFMNPTEKEQRGCFPAISELAPRFFQSLDEFESKEIKSPINILRHEIRLDCERAGEQRPGFFSLTVPTGGGKTLSSMAFALQHALHHDLRRIIFVVPFTTIIEQNSAVFRRHMGKDVIIEHHCNLDPEKENTASRLATENWDAPLIVTTAVQFYESLFANKPSRCRKLHRIARSVIVLDEAQTLPVEYLKPCLRVLRELVRSYDCTIVLCTATQPEIRWRTDFDIGIKGVREIVPDTKVLHRTLKRVNVKDIGYQTDVNLRDRLLRETQVLCIVNTTKHAQRLFEALKTEKGHFHLSARMCPAHRSLCLWRIRRALKSGRICRVVSTQVVEAGVDLDFPVVYRALAGLDSIAQAAGRCNRNNQLDRLGQTFVFISEHTSANRYFADTASCAAQVMGLYPDPLDIEANEHFFTLYYWDQKSRWDAHHIEDNFRLEQDQNFPFNFNFARTAAAFHMIDETACGTVIVPWGRRGRTLCERLRMMPAPNREILRQAQRFAVRVHRGAWNAHAVRDISLIYDNLGILISPESHYDNQTGLNLEAEGPSAYFA